jgi:predicted XRE-type DNA-binding protein
MMKLAFSQRRKQQQLSQSQVPFVLAVTFTAIAEVMRIFLSSKKVSSAYMMHDHRPGFKLADAD